MASPYILPNGSTGSFDHYRPHGHDRTRTAEGDSIMYTNSQSLRKPSSNGSLHTHMHSNSSSSPSFSYHQSENRPSYRANTQIQRLPTVLDALSPSQEKDAMDIPSETATSTAYPQGESYGIPSVGKIALPSGSHNHAGSNHSAVTAYLLLNFGRYPFVHSILSEKDSRRIFYFALLNFGFMLVQTFYGLATGSLGLLSDSIHMLFDCLALVVGLGAAVMSKWPPSMRFPYGLGKMDTLAGFANGIFLMLISVEIVTEAIERLTKGNEMHRLGELFIISVLGLCVNLVGILAFDHGHGHSPGGHSHSHDHSHDHSQPHSHSPHNSHDQSHSHSNDHHHHRHDTPTNPLLAPPSSSNMSSTSSPLLLSTPQRPSPNRTPSQGHHHHANDNMHGIFLHVLADTMGSVAVCISTIFIYFFGWTGFDPIASCVIAVLIFISAIPLVASCARTLLLTIPADTEYLLRETLGEVSQLRGVSSYTVPHFWLEDPAITAAQHEAHTNAGKHDDKVEGGKVLGVIHIIASKTSDLDDVRERTVSFLRSRGLDVVVQVEREGETRCWCGGGPKTQ